MESGLLWRQTVQALHDAEYADVELSHMYADNCAMQLVRNPRQFDVIVTTQPVRRHPVRSRLWSFDGYLPYATAFSSFVTIADRGYLIGCSMANTPTNFTTILQSNLTYPTIFVDTNQVIY